MPLIIETLRKSAHSSNKVLGKKASMYLENKVLEFKYWWNMNQPEYGTSREFHEWELRAKKEAPIRYWLQDTVYYAFYDWVIRPFLNTKWWLTHRFCPYHRYHVIKPKSLSPGYYDTSDRIFHATMDLISDYYDRQKADLGRINWDYDDSYRSDYEQLRKIRDWWRDEYPYRELLLFSYPEEPEGWEDWMLFDSEFQNHPYVLEIMEVSARRQELERTWHDEELEMMASAARLYWKLSD